MLATKTIELLLPKARINLSSRFYEQGLDADRRMIGVVEKSDYFFYKYIVRWENGTSFYYDDKDLEFLPQGD